MTFDYVVIGGGCYGSYYVKQLVEARERGKISWNAVAVLDRRADCAVSEMGHSDVHIEQTEWTEFGPTLFAEPEVWMRGHLVPAPIAPHVILHWLAGALRESFAVSILPWPGAAPDDLPYAQVAETGALVMSWAPGLCPTNCVEPRKCPLTKLPRTWEMSNTAQREGERAGMAWVDAFVCQHHAYGVGTIEMPRVLAAYDRIRASLEDERMLDVGVATVSSCHGLMDLLRIGFPGDRP